MEYVLESFDHELESQRILRAIPAGDVDPALPVFAAQLPQFRNVCERVSRQMHLKLDPDEVARLIVGDGDLGFLISGTLDLDNADNVVRASTHLGLAVDRHLPFQLADWLATVPSAPLSVSEIDSKPVRAWVECRRSMYSTFFESSNEELGRQAFLQHICRRAVALGVPRSTLIWNTDEGLLHTLENFSIAASSGPSIPLRELVQRYRLLDAPSCLAQISIEDDAQLRVFQSPAFTQWLEGLLEGHSFEPFVLVNSRRSGARSTTGTLLPAPAGTLLVFRLGDSWVASQLPTWIRSEISNAATTAAGKRQFGREITKRLPEWAKDRPWTKADPRRHNSTVANLQGVGDWSFRLSRNETLHPYPSTFVHAIPAALISALGLSGDLVVDPFGGTGQTAAEAIKAGCVAVSGDTNSVALLTSRARLVYLPPASRQIARSLKERDLCRQSPGTLPVFDRIEKWHNPKTLLDLCRILEYVSQVQDSALRDFLLATFSSILTSTTSRRGKEHGFFADNTPLARGESGPVYVDAINLFLSKLNRNIDIIERFYSWIERNDRIPAAELSRATVRQANAAGAKPRDYGLEPGTVGGIITSPPYLCMSDYSLGQRLSYYWLFPERLTSEHGAEIGSRRARFRPELAVTKYLQDMDHFAGLARCLLRDGGHLATVMGEPVAEHFREVDVLARVDASLATKGLRLIWKTWRQISWHRNHGYQRLNRERIAVYVAE
jgi:hypothetical protein